MPVGRVFNAAQNQVLISPVSAYYEGKAKRASLKQAEADLEYTQLQSETMKANLEPGSDEATELKLEELRLNVQKKRDELGDAEMKRRADAYGPIIEEATSMSEAGDLDGAIKFANKELKLAAEKLGPEVLEEFTKAKGEDGVLDKEEIARIKYGIAAYYEMADKPSGDNVFSKINPKDYTPESIAEFQRTEDFSVLRKAATTATTTGTKKPTSAQGKAAGYAIRLADANAVFDELELENHDFTGVGSTIASFAPNRWKTDERQKFEQAKENFINAVLRPESGAAIAPSEFEKADSQYFPQPGDGKEVLEQKKANRIAKQAAMEAEAGVEALKLARGRVDALSMEDPDELRLQGLGF